jgi:hypothetical protein
MLEMKFLYAVGVISDTYSLSFAIGHEFLFII